MTTYRHNDREFIDRVERIDITDYVQNFLNAFRRKYGKPLQNKYSTGAEYLRNLLNTPENRVCGQLEQSGGFFYWNSQKVDFIPSNLGENKGFLFYFLCSYCNRRTKYLYRYRTYDEPSCRNCCKLGYVPKPKKLIHI